MAPPGATGDAPLGALALEALDALALDDDTGAPLAPFAEAPFADAPFTGLIVPAASLDALIVPAAPLDALIVPFEALALDDAALLIPFDPPP